MNKLYSIKFMIADVVLSTFNFWNENEAVKCINSWTGVWKATVVEDNDIHKIWEMR